MVRFLKCLCEEFTSQAELDNFIVTENLINLLYIPSSVLISLSSLSKHGIFPHAAKYQWRLLLPASAYLTFTNARDLRICLRNVFLPLDTGAPTHETRLAQIQLVASLFMTFGSLSLLNACLLSMLHIGDNSSHRAGYIQYAVSFGLFVIGSAANTSPLRVDFKEHEAAKALLTFLHILASAVFCLECVLSFPGLVDKESLEFRDVLCTILANIASAILCFSSIVNYFHCMRLLQECIRLHEQEEDGKDWDERKERDSEEGRGMFGRLFGLFRTGSTGFQPHRNCDESKSWLSSEVESLIMTNSSSEASSRKDFAGGPIDVYLEEGNHKQEMKEMRSKDRRTKKRRKGEKR